jgi:hypothetical protein
VGFLIPMQILDSISVFTILFNYIEDIMLAVKEVFSEIETLPKECLPEVLDFVAFLKAKSKGEKKSAFGCLSEYANVSKISLEKGAWEKEVGKK